MRLLHISCIPLLCSTSPSPQHTHMGLSVSPDVLWSHPPLMSLFSHPGLPLSSLTCKTSYAQGNVLISQEPSNTWSSYKEPQTCSITSLSFWLPCRNPWWPHQGFSGCTAHKAGTWLPSGSAHVTYTCDCDLNLEVILDRNCTEYVTVWMVWPKMYYKWLGECSIYSYFTWTLALKAFETLQNKVC